MDKLAAMRTFVKVAELGSFTRAADACGISRTVATTHVARLEAQLGSRLLNRTTRRLSLTEAGTAYFERSRELLAELDSLEGSLEAMADRPEGLLKIAAPLSFGISHLAEALAAYAEKHPKVRLDVNLNDRVVDLVEEGFDVAIRISRLVDSSLVARQLASTRLCLCASPAWVKRYGMPRTPEDIARHPVLGYAYASGGGSWTLEGPDGPRDVRFRSDSRANNGDFLRVMAMHGHGIALLPTFMVGPDLKAKRLVEVMPEWSAGELGIFAIYPSRKYLSAKVRTLVDFLAERFRRVKW